MPEYDRFCPISLGSEVLADRWTPLIMRELIIGSTRFNDIARGLPDISRSLLSQRLRHLERKGVLERWPAPNGRGSEYRLTPAGKDLEQVVMALGLWAVQWLYQDIDPADIDAVTLMWWMHRHIDWQHAAAGTGRRAVRPHRARTHHGVGRARPRRAVGVHPASRLRRRRESSPARRPCSVKVFNGMTTWRHALASGELRAEGPPRIVRHLPGWFASSPFARRGADAPRLAATG